MTVWRLVRYRQMKVIGFENAFAGKPRSYRFALFVGARLAREDALKTNQSSRAFTDLGDNRKLRRLRLTLLRWLTRLGPRAMATPIANTSITTK
ncbi:hypothetical protein PMI33_01550 [Pseudomonas sp. GM67]|nr:hypothetical protein PMI33_01550 [Pseudomonas sp. GM67]